MEKWYKIHLLSSVFNMLPPILASKNFILVSPHLSQGPSGDPEIQIRVLHSRFVLSFFLPSSLSFLRPPPFLSDCTAFLWALFLNTDLVQRTLANHSPQGPWHSQAFQQCTWMIAGGVPQRWKVPVTLFERPVYPCWPGNYPTGRVGSCPWGHRCLWTNSMLSTADARVCKCIPNVGFRRCWLRLAI